MNYSNDLVSKIIDERFSMINKLIIIKVNRDVGQQPISVTVQLLDLNDRMILQTTLPISMFKDTKGIEVGKRIYLTCDY